MPDPTITIPAISSTPTDSSTSPVVPSTIGFNSINNPTPLTPPPISNGASSLNALVNSTVASANTANTADTSAETDVNNTTSDLSKLTESLGGQGADQINAEANQGIPTMNKDLQDLQAKASQENIQYQNTPYSLAGQGRGITTGILRGEEAVKQRQIGLDLLVTNSNIAAKQGNIALAQSLADKSVAAKYDPIKAAIEAKKVILNQQNNNLNRADTKAINAQKTALDLQSKQIDEKIQNEKDSNAIKQTAITNGAPTAVIMAMDKIIQAGGDSSQILTLAKGYMSDPLAKKIQEAQLAKLNQDISNGALQNKVYVAGANPQVDALVASINSGKSKLSDITGNPALKNLVQQGLALSSGSTSNILSTTQDSLKELQTMVDNNTGFTGAVGFKGIQGSLLPGWLGGGHPIAGTDTADFAAKAKQVVNDIVLPNLTLLHGLGRVTDREFQALQSAITSLSIDPHTGTSSLSEGAFKTELNNITKRINDLASSQTNSSTSSAIIPKGTDGTAYGFPGYTSDGTQWVPK